ncbi:MAG: hypothetical protein KKC51_10745 [Verrucomicrobia bacterium]|nr:hypothetical protein [Verrucomicrobiota bacterium]
MKNKYGLGIGILLLACSPALAASIILNGDFEEHGGSWNTWSNWVCCGSSGTLEQGYYRSATTCARTWAHESGLYQDCVATAGVAYIASAYLYTPTGDRYGWDAASNTYACVRLEFKDAGSGDLGGTVESAHFTPDNPADTWTYLSVTGVAPANTAYARIVLGIRGALPGAGTVAFDDASAVEELTSPFHYVSTNGAHQTPFTNWVTAATNIQAAVDAAVDGDTVLVSNGVPDFNFEMRQKL